MRTRPISAIGHTIGVLLIWIGIMFPTTVAQASWLDRVKDIYQLPENVEQIQKDYEATKQQLEEQKDKLSETIRHSQETEESYFNKTKHSKGK